MSLAVLTETTLVSIADRLLALTVNSLVAAGLTVPTRQVVYLAEIPTDCEQVAVLFDGWYLEPTPLDSMVTCLQARWAAGLAVVISRCTPALPKTKGRTVSAPEVTEMHAAADIASADAEALLLVLQGIAEFGSDAAISTPSPSGGFQTVTLTLRVPVGAL